MPIAVLFCNTTEDKVLRLDIGTAVQLALKNNLGIEKKKIKLDSYRWAMATSGNEFLPNVNFGFSLNHFDDNTLTKKTIINDNYVFNPNIPNWSAGIDLSISFSFNANMIFEVYRTIIDWKNGELSLEKAEKKLVRDVKKIYYSLIVIRDNMDIINQKIDAAKRRYEQAQINRDIGESTRADELSAKATYENLKFVYVEVENSYKQALLDFKQMTGLKEKIHVVLTDDIPDIREYKFDDPAFLNDYLDKFMDKNLEIQSLNIDLQRLKNIKNINAAALSPTFNFYYIYDPFYINDPFVSKKNMFASGYDWIERSGILSFSVSIPLTSWIPFSREQMNIVHSNYDIKEVKKNILQLKMDVRRKIMSIILNLEKSLKAFEILKLNIELSQEAYEKTNDAYKIGSKKLIEVVDAENELNNAKLNLLRQKYEYSCNLLDLEYELNMKIDDIFKTGEDNK